MDAQQQRKGEQNVEKMLNENPLTIFSIYTDGQWKTVHDLGLGIIQCLDQSITNGDGTTMVTVDGSGFSRSYNQFWLWTLAAYEIVRTMCQAKQCFSDRLVSELAKLENELRLIRVVLAKQEVPWKRGERSNKKAPVSYEASVHLIRHSPPDLIFKVQGQEISARGLIEQFARVFSGITRADVLADHRTSYRDYDREAAIQEYFNPCTD
jgi:hypothetical protein